VAKGCQDLKTKHGNRQIICGCDIGQRLNGTSLKFLAYERLLQDYPAWQQKVVLVQRILVPGSRKKDEQLTLRELRAVVQRIQDKFGPHVIDYQEVAGSTLPMDQRLALWKASDVLMLTPIREGLNHWPMEYIYAKDADQPGVVIASEFSAVCSILNGALRVNPFDIQMTNTIIDKALSMEFQEKEGRRYRDLDFVSNCPSDKWVRNVLRDLNDATASSNKSSSASSMANSSAATPTTGIMTPKRNNKREQLQGTAAFLLKESHAAFTHLNPKVLKLSYDQCKNRVIILDFNGTIVLKEPPGKYLKREILGTSGNKPPPQVLEALALLCQDPKNTVYVNSGDSAENVMAALGHIPNLGLAVSNGAKFSPPLTDHDSERRWQTFDLGVDWDAVKRVALPVLSKYTARSNGSFVKLTTFSIGWSYYSCDPEWGSLQASHLVLELEAELKAFDVRFVTLKGIVEVVPRKLNKGLIVKKVLRDISRTHPQAPIDFILCLGDDISDEKMFTSVFSFIAEMGDERSAHPDPPVVNEDGTLEEPSDWSMTQTKIDQPLYSYTCAVGKKPSHASMWVADAQEVAKSLVLLAKGDGVGAPTWVGAPNTADMFT
jgi:trehalose 6-phosphate synthase/phosphatase